jgi:tryptophan synthase alpha chain
MVNRIDTALTSQPPGLWPFVVAGYPDALTTAAILRALGGLPIRGVEVGFPFSDPIADGPVIQQAFNQVLSAGLRVSAVFDLIAGLGAEVAYPLLAMVSASIVYRIGAEQFLADAAAAGFDGLIVPDLSLEEAPALAKAAGAAGLRLSMLVAPTTTSDREKRIAEVTSGFLYYVSVQGTTGARAALPGDVREHVVRLKGGTGLPVLVGFGISTPQQVREVCGFADGAIVGSTIVRRIGELLSQGRPPAEITAETTRFVASLAGR